MKKPNVLFVYPEFPPTFWGFNSSVAYQGWGKGRKRALMTPTGSATVAAMMPEDFNITGIVDMNVEPLTDEHIQNTDYVVTTTMAAQENSHNEVIRRAHSFGKKVISGGPFPTSSPERNNEADYVVGGEAELTLKPFLEDLLNGKAGKFYTEESVLKSGRFDPANLEHGKPSLALTPIPRWDLVNLKRYKLAGIQTGRACPFKCEFCDIRKLFGEHPRNKPVDQAIEELDVLHYYMPRGGVMILNDNILADRNYLRNFLQAAIIWQEKNKRPFLFTTQVSADLAWDQNRDILENMVRAGFESVFVGYESVDREALKNMHKEQNLVLPPLDATRRMQKAGLSVTGGFFVGSDDDKPTVFDDLFNFIQEAGIVIPMIGLLTALEGTDLQKKLEREGRMRAESTGNNVHHLGFNFEPKLPEDFLTDGYVDLLNKVFSPKNYYARCRTLLENLGENSLVGNADKSDVLAFGRSLYKQIFAKGGWEYAKHLAGTLISNPKKFPQAVAQGIYSDHLAYITKAVSDVHGYNVRTQSLYESFRGKVEDAFGSMKDGAVVSEKKVVEMADRIIARAEREYSKLHFKEDARNAFESLKDKVYRDIERFRSRRSLAT